MKHKVYFSLGSNLGDKEGNIREAIKRIGELIGEVDRQSTLLVTEPWGFESDNSFVNAAVRCITSLAPSSNSNKLVFLGLSELLCLFLTFSFSCPQRD